VDREDIIRMAREAGVYLAHTELTLMTGLERFANLVAAHEREECAKLCDEQATDYEESDPWNGCARYLANHIRARGEK
jgi:hypothetical protein